MSEASTDTESEEQQSNKRPANEVKVVIVEDSKRATIRIVGRFDFSVVIEFRNTYFTVENATTYQWSIDMRSVHDMDSSGLGMLLNMKKYLNAPEQGILITNCQPSIKKMFKITKFYRFFAIS